MLDLNVRELEERALQGDRAALEALRGWWRRQGDPEDGTALMLRQDQLMFRGVLAAPSIFEHSITLGRLDVMRFSMRNLSVDPMELEVWAAEEFVAIRGRKTDLPEAGPGELSRLPTFRSPLPVEYELAPFVSRV